MLSMAAHHVGTTIVNVFIPSEAAGVVAAETLVETISAGVIARPLLYSLRDGHNSSYASLW